MKQLSNIIAILLLLVFSTTTRAAVVLSGNFNTGTPTPMLTISEDIVLNISATGNIGFLVFDEWTVSDGGFSGANPNPGGQQLFYSLNTTDGVSSISSLYDNMGGMFGVITANDGFLEFSGPKVSLGDTFTVRAGNYSFTSDGTFNPLLAGKTFTGNVFLANSIGSRLSDSVTVPEPSVLLSFALTSLLLMRRKR